MSFYARAIPCLLFVCECAVGQSAPYPQRPEVQAFIHELVQSHGFEAAALERLFAGVQADRKVLALAAPPASVPHIKNWRVYRSRFLDRATIRAGAQFWRQHAASLARAEKEFGVPAEIIAGILGVETLYGRSMGRFPVLDTLVTLSFDYPDVPSRDGRIALFRQQLSNYLIWCRDTKQDVHGFTGSYTGAIGIPQFLPGSIRAYGVDFDGDGRIDLRSSPVDAIGSVANFLHEHGWEWGRPVLWRVANDPRSLSVLSAKGDGDSNLKYRLEDLMEAGLKPLIPKRAWKAEKETKVLLVDLPTPGAPTEYRIGFKNFYVITRYNRSFFYAMAVVELGHAVKSAALRPQRSKN